MEYMVNYIPNFPGKAWNVGISLPIFQNLKVIYIFKSQFLTHDFFLRSNLLLIETHYKVISNEYIIDDLKLFHI